MNPTFGTWNLNGWADGQADLRARRLEELGLDLLCAQELTLRRYKAQLAALGSGWWGRFSLCVPAASKPRSYWGVAVFGRRSSVSATGNCRVLGDGDDSVGSSLFWRRTLAVPVTFTSGAGCDVVSVHVRPAATIGKQKEEFLRYLAPWLSQRSGQMVLGVDTNCRVFTDVEEQGWPYERVIWGMDAPHELRDAWGSKPFEATHRINDERSARFDQIWVSSAVMVKDIHRAPDVDNTYGSDHDLVVAELGLSREPQA